MADAFKKLGILGITAFRHEDDWYSYFINEYLPPKGEEYMETFIDLGFHPMPMLLWMLCKEGHLDHKPIFKEALNKKLAERMAALSPHKEVT